MDAEGNNLYFPIILLLLSLCLLIFKNLKSPSSSPPLPPGPFSWPIIGNIFQMGNKPHITLTQFAKSYGPLFSIRLGTQLVIIGSSQESAIEILKTQDRVLSGRSPLYASPPKSTQLNHLSVGWIAECNEHWKYLRTTIRTELFSGKAMASQAGAREKMVIDMINFINKMEGKDLRIRQVAFAAIFNMLGNILLSKDVINFEYESVEGEICGPLREMIEVGAASNVSDLFPILAGLDLQGLQRKSREWFKKICKIWEVIINERREKNKGDSDKVQRDFLDALINNGSSNDQINMLLMEMFSAGTDSSSSSIEWMMAELIRNPKYMKKVEEEIQRETNNEENLDSHLHKFTFLQACFKETLRLHPPGPLLVPHRATESCQVMNYTIPKNSQVMVNFWAIGRDPKIWEDPLEFKPERFLNSNLDFKGNDFEYIPFSSGRRICPGLPMASKQVPLIVACLVHFFDWSLPNGQIRNAGQINMNEKYGLTLMKEQPLLLIPKSKK
ncbi:hypothetical protein JCGZ_20659 [Jatropha curcas]|uniref:Uncharacterized protein n=1 Tax=Jatropha curcas TaxID=180498 RepID=A0A067JRP5_JATCU|nr:probable (S)-N-methylcoclaurine 3'-hydroxylase isozyme 2 [Jatropha curcas]KDP25503.1 hypothetical protein JCGZ_20659 [Jatropha curcas]